MTLSDSTIYDVQSVKHKTGDNIHRRGQGVHGVQVDPQGENATFGLNLWGELSRECSPQGEGEKSKNSGLNLPGLAIRDT